MRKKLLDKLYSRDFRISALFILLGTLVGSLLLPSSDRASLVIFDFFQRATLLSKQNNVALVVVDQRSLDQLAKEMIVFPIPRQIYGAVAKVGATSSAKMIIYDLLFTEPSSYGESDDRLFSELLKESKIPIIFPAASKDGHTKQPIPKIIEAASALGSVNSENDSDGVFRRYLGGNSLANVVFKKFYPAIEPDPPKYLHFYKSETFPTISLYDILIAQRELEEGRRLSVDLSGLKEKIWIVGYTATGLFDLKPTPHNHSAPGLLIPATAIANILQNDGLKSFSIPVGIIVCLITSILSLLIVRSQRGPSWALLGLFLINIVGVTGLVWFLWSQGLWLSPLPIALSGLVAGGCGTTWVFRTVWRNHSRFAKMVQHSMSPVMVELIRKGEVNISRYGELRNITVLFSDLAGFTDLSETLSPEELIEILNGYFDEVVVQVTQASGYVDKFIGDAVMALWGAPISQENHAQLALHAAIHFHDATERYNQKLLQMRPNLKPLGTRIGLHSGTAIVGNIGARHRHNYTAVGDTVNLSARLEGLNKVYGTQLILSEDCLLQANAVTMDGIIEIDRVMVKGRTNPTRIFTYTTSLTVAEKQQHKNGLSCYYLGDWQQALKLFEGLNFSPSQLMIERCKKALEQGALDAWKDGIWIYDTK